MKALSKLTIFGVLLCLTFTTVGYSQTAQLSASKDSITVGEVFSLGLKVQYNQPRDVISYPDSSMFPPELSVVDIQQFKLTDFADSLSYSIQYFGIEDITISSLYVEVVTGTDTSMIFSNPVTIAIKSVLATPEDELKPIKPILLFDSFPWGLMLIILVIVAALIWAYFTFFKKEEEVFKTIKLEPVPFSNPLAILEQQLSDLKNDYNLSQTRDFKFFYSTISDSIRAYFEELYKIPALESTTRELNRYLDAFGVDHEMIQKTRAILRKADMVKFAKFTPTLDDAWNCYADSIDFVERAKLIDASRIARQKADHESKFETVEVNEEEAVNENSETE